MFAYLENICLIDWLTMAVIPLVKCDVGSRQETISSEYWYIDNVNNKYNDKTITIIV